MKKEEKGNFPKKIETKENKNNFVNFSPPKNESKVNNNNLIPNAYKDGINFTIVARIKKNQKARKSAVKTFKMSAKRAVLF